MSWFLVVKQGVALPAAGRGPAGTGSSSNATATSTTLKLIVWGTGKEVPSLLFDLVQVRTPCHAHAMPCARKARPRAQRLA